MTSTSAAWEGVAAALLSETCLDDPPVSALQLAAMCGLRVHLGGSGASLAGGVISAPAKVATTRLHGLIAHELGHWALARYDEPDSEEGASYVGGALMLPQARFGQDLRATSWHLPALQAVHTNVSAEAIGHRICQLRDAVVSVYDQGRLTKRLVSPWLEDRRFKRVSSWERGLVDQAYATGQMVWGDDLVHAWPVFTDRWRRVVLIAEARQLALRW